MEGWNPSIGCYTNCKSCFRGWVPNPLNYFVRRNPLAEAIERTDAIRTGQPHSNEGKAEACNLENAQQKCGGKEQEECCQKYNTWRNSLTPYVQVTNNCDRPVCLVNEDEMARERDRYVMVDLPVRTNILSGTFNPDDNKTTEQLLREKCDRFWQPCGASLRPYPCRGVIDFPRQQLIDTHQPNYELNASICAGTKYVDPEFLEKQYEECKAYEKKKEEDRVAKCQEMQYKWQQKHGACWPPQCPSRPCCP